MANTEQANKVLKELIAEFKNGTIGKSISKIPLIKDPTDNRPCWNWSLRNRYLMIIQGSKDARNFAEWQRQHRTVKKSTDRKHDVFILAPLMSKFITIDKETREEKEELKLTGFRTQQEFDVNDTYGIKLPEYKPAKIPPFIDVAKEWKIEVKYSLDITESSLGYTNAKSKDGDKINLSTENPKVFFHELAHQADKRQQNKELNGGQDPIQEATAELSACVLAELHGIDAQKSNTWDYLRNNTKDKTDEQTEKLALKVLDRVGKVLDLILTTAQKLEEKKNPKVEKIAMEIKVK